MSMTFTNDVYDPNPDSLIFSSTSRMAPLANNLDSRKFQQPASQPLPYPSSNEWRRQASSCHLQAACEPPGSNSNRSETSLIDTTVLPNTLLSFPSFSFPLISSHNHKSPAMGQAIWYTRVRPGCGPSKALEMFFVSFSFPSSFLSLIFYFILISAGLHQERKGKANNKNRFMVLVLVIVMARPPPVYYPQFFLERFFFFGFRCRRR
jgi:hypothetical protein